MNDTMRLDPRADTWQQRLDAAHSEAEVVAVVQDFVDRMGKEVIARLPTELQPGRFLNAGDVTAYAFSVVLHGLKGASELAETVQAMASFFMGAATRLTQLLARIDASDKGSGRSS